MAVFIGLGQSSGIASKVFPTMKEQLNSLGKWEKHHTCLLDIMIRIQWNLT